MKLIIAILLGGIVGVLLTSLAKILHQRRKPTRCSTCKHFDLQEGQAAMRAHPVFMQAAAVLPPSKMGTVVTYDDDGNRHESGPPIAQASRWDQFGACSCPSQLDEGNAILKWGGDICPDFKMGTVDQTPQLVQIRPR
jgi:hypothetical protein